MHIKQQDSDILLCENYLQNSKKIKLDEIPKYVMNLKSDIFNYFRFEIVVFGYLKIQNAT